MTSSGHDCGRLTLIIFSLFIFVCMIFVNSGASIPGVAEVLYGTEEGANMENLSPYTIDINPAGWTFSVWGIIYLWQCVMMAYILSLTCRRCPADGRYLYISPEGLFPISFFLTYILNNLTNAAWLMVAAREWLHAGLGVIAVMWLATLAPLIISCWALEKKSDQLKKFELTKEAWLIRFMVHNGLGMYAGWMTVATLLNLGIVLVHWVGMDNVLACTILLAILAGEVALYVVLDFFVLHRYTNYLFTPYFVIIWAIIGSLAKNFVPWRQNSIITVVLLALVTVAAIAKVIIMVLRHVRSSKSRATISYQEPEKTPVA